MMTRIILGRLAQAVLLMLGVSFIGFMLMNLAPGGPMALYTNSPGVDAADIARMRASLHLDEPLPAQYLRWLAGLLTGDWGKSFFGGRAVTSMVAERLPATLELMGLSTLLAMTAGVMSGVVAAVRRGSAIDHLVTGVSLLALSMPTFWFALLGIFVFAQHLEWLPVGGRTSAGQPGGPIDRIEHLILPVTVLTIVLSAQWSRHARSAMIDVLGQPYMRTALAKGLSPARILWRHGFRSALLPLIALAGLQLPLLVSGALVTETVFAWPGMGQMFISALSYRDYPVLMAVLMLSALLVIVGNMLADVAVALADRRVRAGRAG
jgi:peptide/nickel transport system permease protein